MWLGWIFTPLLSWLWSLKKSLVKVVALEKNCNVVILWCASCNCCSLTIAFLFKLSALQYIQTSKPHFRYGSDGHSPGTALIWFLYQSGWSCRSGPIFTSHWRFVRLKNTLKYFGIHLCKYGYLLSLQSISNSEFFKAFTLFTIVFLFSSAGVSPRVRPACLWPAWPAGLWPAGATGLWPARLPERTDDSGGDPASPDHGPDFPWDAGPHSLPALSGGNHDGHVLRDWYLHLDHLSHPLPCWVRQNFFFLILAFNLGQFQKCLLHQIRFSKQQPVYIISSPYVFWVLI